MKTSHPNNGRDALEHMTKSQLRQQLAEALETLKKEEARLAVYQEQIKETQTEVVDLKELTERSKSAEKELEKAQARVEEMAAAATKLRQEINESKRVNETLRKDNEGLQDQLRAAHDKVSQQAEITKREQREAERQRLQLEDKIRELEGRIQELQKTTITLKEKLAMSVPSPEVPSEGVMAPTASFRIDLYPQEGNYQGKIEHLLSREKKAFKGLEQNEIMQFISSHLPRLEKEMVRAEATAPLIPEAPAVPEAKKRGDLRVLLSELNATRPGAEAPGNFVICKGEPFEVGIKVDFSDISLTDLPLNYQLTMYAKHLESKTREIIGETTKTITAAGVFHIRIQAKALPAGLYRLETSLTSKLKEGKLVPYTSFVQGGLVQVY